MVEVFSSCVDEGLGWFDVYVIEVYCFWLQVLFQSLQQDAFSASAVSGDVNYVVGCDLQFHIVVDDVFLKVVYSYAECFSDLDCAVCDIRFGLVGDVDSEDACFSVILF